LFTDGRALIFGADGNVYALLTLLFFGIIVFLQRQSMDGKVSILIPACILSFHLSSNPLLKLLFVLIMGAIVFFALRKLNQG